MSYPDPSSPTPQAKRKRLLEPEEVRDATRLKRSGFWFDDGTIILQAQNTQFRVHRSILARNSNVFRDMFSLPQSSDGEELIDGCVVVPVTDAPQEWEFLFSILYDNVISYQRPEVFPLPLLASMLLLGRKYEFDKLRNAAIDRLSTELPNSLQHWDWQIFGNRFPGSPHIRGHEFDVVNLVIQEGLDACLPTAYLACLMFRTMADVMDGSLRADGTTASLSDSSKSALVLGRDSLCSAMSEYTYGLLKSSKKIIPSDDCEDQDECTNARLKKLDTLVLSLQSSVPLALHPPPKHITDGLCDTCIKVFVIAFEAGRNRIWLELPQHFRLPSRESLKNL